MIAVLEHKFFLSEIIGRKVYLNTERAGRLSDMVMVESEMFAEVTDFIVSRPFGHPPLQGEFSLL